MELTGKCKQDFLTFLNSKEAVFIGTDTVMDAPNIYHRRHFSQLPKSMQFGVLEDFFESKNIIIDVQPFWDYDTSVLFWMACAVPLNIEILERSYDDTEHKTRQEAREKAIKKANEIYNSTKQP